MLIKLNFNKLKENTRKKQELFIIMSGQTHRFNRRAYYILTYT